MTQLQQKSKILIVDDQRPNIVVLRRILSVTNVEILEAQTGELALKLCREHDFAVVLLDVIMPVMDGFEVARELRKNEATKNLPILFITAYDMDDQHVVAAYNKLEAVDFIQKPLKDKILLARVSVFLKLWNEKRAREDSILLLAEQKKELEREVKRRKEVEEQLRISHQSVTIRAIDRESRLQATMENALDAIICIDTNGIVVEFNPAAENLFGFKQHEILGKDIAEKIVPPELRQQHRQGLSRYIEKMNCGKEIGGNSRMVDTLGLRADGKRISLEVSISSFSCEDGTHLTAFFRDITDRKQFSRALVGTLEAAEDAHKELNQQKDFITQSNAYTQSIIDSMGDALIVLSTKGLIQRVNEPACQMLAGSEADLVGQNISEFFSSYILDGLDDNEMTVCVDSIKAHNESQNSEDNFRSLDGCTVQVLISSSILYNANKEVSGIILVAKDITEYKRAEEELLEKEKQLLIAEKKASKAKDRFLAHMSHEIRTPMNAIIGLTDQALLTEPPDRTQNFLKKVMNSSRFLLRIIDDILDFSKIEAGKLELEMVDFKLSNLLNNLADLFSEKVAEKSVTLQMHLPAKYPDMLVGDSLRLEQVLMNLIANAIKFTDEGEIGVTVSVVSQQKDEVVLMFSVRDTGIGMSTEYIESLFQPFIQEDSSTSRKYGGTGLGLTICKRLVEKMGGIIQVQSTPGQGSNFQFSAAFALRTAGEPVKSGEVEEFTLQISPDYLDDVTKKIAGCHVLLVEDNHINQQVAAEILGNVGLEVQIVDNGMDAIRMVESVEFDVILMDIQMPEMDGFVTTSHIRKLAYGKDVPIIAVTAHALEEDRQLCLASGMNDHIPKPIDKKKLFDAMIRLIPEKDRSQVVVSPKKISNSEDSTLPEFLAGIDVEVGVERLDGNQELYMALLEDFVQEFSTVVEDVRNCLFDDVKEDIPTARRLLHSVRGMSGNLAATELNLAASNLEKAIIENRPDDWLDMMEAFTVACNLVMRSISAMNKAGDDTNTNNSSHHEAQLDEIEKEINELAISLKKKRFRAKKQLATLKTKIGQEVNSETMGLLESAIEKYDFVEAHKHLQALAELIGITITQEEG
ncbi:MAG: response regulator [Magnetococcales bacterium]|nr:response regulator [Magnetococcales bacterium]